MDFFSFSKAGGGGGDSSIRGWLWLRWLAIALSRLERILLLCALNVALLVELLRLIWLWTVELLALLLTALSSSSSSEEAAAAALRRPTLLPSGVTSRWTAVRLIFRRLRTGASLFVGVSISNRFHCVTVVAGGSQALLIDDRRCLTPIRPFYCDEMEKFSARF